jgi:lysophospholipase L1-like esterase
MKNVLLLFSSLILAFAVSIGLDRLAGLFQPAKTQSAGLIFPPNVEHNFRTREFSYKVQTNSLGFRDREFDLEKTAKTRILALGDSFTFGFGVEANQAWPKALEAHLRAAGYDLEIANLGRPAGSPREYAAIAEKAIPLLKPDWVIVAVLQGDDLAQMADAPQADSVIQYNTPEDMVTAHPRLRRVTASLYPHLLAMVDKIFEPQVFYKWKKDAQRLLINMTPTVKARFEKLDPGVQEAFLNGQLNPALINISTTRPDYFLSTMDVTSPNTQHLVLEMANQLARIDNAARQSQAKAIVVSVPYGVYVSQNSFKTRQRLGFEVVPDMLTTSAGDEPIRRASEIAGLPFYDVTDEFRQASLQRNLFFELDGHFNAQGHERFAALLMPAIQKIILERDAKQETQRGRQ